jgi:hypothetical protein
VPKAQQYTSFRRLCRLEVPPHALGRAARTAAGDSPAPGPYTSHSARAAQTPRFRAGRSSGWSVSEHEILDCPVELASLQLDVPRVAEGRRAMLAWQRARAAALAPFERGHGRATTSAEVWSSADRSAGTSPDAFCSAPGASLCCPKTAAQASSWSCPAQSARPTACYQECYKGYFAGSSSDWYWWRSREG